MAVYRLVEGEYLLQIGEPFWMPEIGLGIGRTISHTGGVRREILSWYDERGSRYYTAEETAQQARQQAELAQQQAAEAIE